MAVFVWRKGASKKGSKTSSKQSKQNKAEQASKASEASKASKGKERKKDGRNGFTLRSARYTDGTGGQTERKGWPEIEEGRGGRKGRKQERKQGSKQSEEGREEARQGAIQKLTYKYGQSLANYFEVWGCVGAFQEMEMELENGK